MVITTNPIVTDSGDVGVTFNYQNSLSGRFQLGETITGGNSGATGTLIAKNADMNQLVLKDVTGTFIGSSVSGQNATETVTGNESGDDVNTNDVYQYLDAPHSYYRTDDPEERRAQTNGVFIPGGVPASELTFQTNRSYLFETNEARSRIRVIDPKYCLLYTSPSPRDRTRSRMPSSA